MIGIVDYGMGNIKAFANIYRNLKIDHKVCCAPPDFNNVSKIILPGVGAFDHAMEQLEHSGMKNTLEGLVLEKKLPVLGICVGMQILAKSSDEGQLDGLNWIDAEVKKFDKKILNKKRPNNDLPLPHMGWNTVLQRQENPLFRKIDNNSKFYFLHSYYFKPKNSDDAIAVTEYGCEFSCAINEKNIYGVQFHPEKSHQYGIQLLKNFGEF